MLCTCIVPHPIGELQYVKELENCQWPSAAVDDANMGGRDSDFQIPCKNIFQLSCNCLKVSEKIFNWGWYQNGIFGQSITDIHAV
jgi:hypothetical protein